MNTYSSYVKPLSSPLFLLLPGLLGRVRRAPEEGKKKKKDKKKNKDPNATKKPKTDKKGKKKDRQTTTTLPPTTTTREDRTEQWAKFVLEWLGWMLLTLCLSAASSDPDWATHWAIYRLPLSWCWWVTHKWMGLAIPFTLFFLIFFLFGPLYLISQNIPLGCSNTFLHYYNKKGKAWRI